MSKFESLGKATRRGIKKCNKCGIYNGTKSIACKNKYCDMIFKDSTEKRKVILDSVQLITSNLRKLYSVRVRDHGPDNRGFVQLPVIHSLHIDDTSNPVSEVALCFVDNCPRIFQGSFLQCHSNFNNQTQWDTTNSCLHINASVKSRTSATYLPINLHIILKLKISKVLKQNVLILANESSFPIVQRVTKNVLAVKCQVTPKHPLGYLHFTLITGPNKNCGTHVCGCSDIAPSPKCLHFYLCISALASDSKCIYEFSSFIESEFEDGLKSFLDVNSRVGKMNINYNASKQNIDIYKVESTIRSMKNKKKIINGTQFKIVRKIWPKIYPIQINILNHDSKDSESYQESNPIWTFNNWLAFVVESMNKLIVFENAGILNNLVFHIPSEFYRTFRKKIPCEYLRPIIKNVSEYEVIDIMNISHVKHIFNNSKVKLKVSKRFVLGDNSVYVEIDETDDSTGDLMPHFIYFLNVGELTVDDSDNTNNFFRIEWIPNSTVTNVGQLKIQYKYGRKCL
ncbi:hypothetical protein WA026_008646 [Henosepilachna vigintioctopunctata]|uniref:Putative treble-clef zinc-finger domain-containing protein n=1 Tax=Henosepilachna vigintioctopunctata TaxID=420089 RepID=A0AAW1UH18_9CUCU